MAEHKASAPLESPILRAADSLYESLTSHYLTAEDLAIYASRPRAGKAIALALSEGDCVDYRAMFARQVYAQRATRGGRRLSPAFFADWDAQGPLVRKYIERVNGVLA